jgi:SpoVK/Ycf46/Vps4 family AAA+-type ATPase
MDDEIPDIDEKALRKVGRIDRAIQRMRRDDQGAFMAITNALEHHLEIYPRDPETVRHLARALEAFLRARGIDSESAGFAKQLHDLLDYA